MWGTSNPYIWLLEERRFQRITTDEDDYVNDLSMA